MFPLIYHAHHTRHNDDLPFWLDLAQQLPGPILELGCGSGRVLLPLAQAGHRVIGLDRDYQMLAYLRQRLPPDMHLPIFQADLSRFRVSVQFGFILLPCNTFSTLTVKEQRSALACIARQLVPGGWFVFGIPNPILLKRLPACSEPELEEIFSHPLDGEPVQVISGWRRTRKKFILSWHYDHLFSNGQVERLTAIVEHQLSTVSDYQEVLQAAGMEVAETYGDYDRSPYHDDAPCWIALATRRF